MATFTAQIAPSRFRPRRRRSSLSSNVCGPGGRVVCEGGASPLDPNAVCRCVYEAAKRCEPPCKRGQICHDGKCKTLFTDEPQDPLGDDRPEVKMLLAQPNVTRTIEMAAQLAGNQWQEAKRYLVAVLPRLPGCPTQKAWTNLDESYVAFETTYGRVPSSFDDTLLIYRGAAKLCGMDGRTRRPARRVARSLRRR